MKNITIINPNKYSVITNFSLVNIFSDCVGSKISAKFKVEIEIKKLKYISDNFKEKAIL